MSRILVKGNNPENIVKHVGVIICLNRDDTRHLGIAYKRDDLWRFLHLADHHDLRDDEINDWAPYVCVNPEPGLLAIQLERVEAFCRLVSERNSDAGIPYAFSTPSNWFDNTTGTCLVGNPRLGLTCASFVISVFADIGCPLILQETWQFRDEDRVVQERFLESIATRHGEAHANAARRELPALRFRPEEVAGATACDPIPANFQASVEMSLVVLQILRQPNTPSPLHT